jgi:GNAT superfamily N-acetyltransferase
MFSVKRMSLQDFKFAVRITEPLGWGLSEKDFEFMVELEPEGCFVLLDGSRRIGLATTISYGALGWFGNLVVLDSHRGRGAGSMLVKHSVEYLFGKGVKAVGLYAYMERIHFYERLGFKFDLEFIVLKGRGCDLAVNSAVRKVEDRDLPGIIEFDRNCFGTDRKKLLEPIILDKDNLCSVIAMQGHTVGYAVAKVYDHIGEVGPVVWRASEEQAAFSLLNFILSKLRGYEISMYAPQSENKVIAHLKKAGFSESFHVARMLLGSANFRECIFMAESLERG